MTPTTSVKSIQTGLENIIRFWMNFSAITHSHMVGFLTENHWKNLVPIEIQNEVTDCNHDHTSILDLFFTPLSAIINHNEVTREFPAITSFIRSIDNLLNENFYKFSHVTSSLELEINKLGIKRAGTAKRLTISEFMTPKKNHEVEVLSYLIAQLCADDASTLVIDAGDGKGYLSSRLALEYNFNVLGIDASHANTSGAEKRVTKLSKAWKGLNRRAENIADGLTPPRRGRRPKTETPVSEVSVASKDNYKTITQFITQSTDFPGLVREHFPDIQQPNAFLLSGLHTCGNLASDCFKIFTANENIRMVANVGCCYHLLTEEFTTDHFVIDKCNKDEEEPNPLSQSEPGFPMSTFLREQKFHLGRNPRMLASQSVHRITSARELPNPTLFYRALLQLLLQEKNKSELTSHVGRIKCNNFIEYVRKCSQKLNLGLDDLTDGELSELELKYDDDRKLLHVFYLLRIHLAPVLESIILLDRVLYLVENGVENVFLAQLFDPVVSPRCYGIIGIK